MLSMTLSFLHARPFKNIFIFGLKECKNSHKKKAKFVFSSTNKQLFIKNLLALSETIIINKGQKSCHAATMTKVLTSKIIRV